MPRTVVKSIITIRNLTLKCEEVYGNGMQAALGLYHVPSMPKDQGMIFYLEQPVPYVEITYMQFPLDVVPIANGVVSDSMSTSKILVEMNSGLVEQFGIEPGDKVTISRVLG